MTDQTSSSLETILSRRNILVGGAFLAAAGTALARTPEPNMPPVKKEAFEAMFPDTMGDWTFMTASGLVLPPSDALSDRLYDNLVTRVYTNSRGDQAMWLVAYNNHQDGVLQIHRPEVCYPAGGYVLTDTEPTNIAIGGGKALPGSFFVARSNERVEQVLYWTRVGDAFPQNWREQRLDVFKANLRRIVPDGLLARVSMASDDIVRSKPVMEDFVASLRNAAPAKLRTLLFGARG